MGIKCSNTQEIMETSLPIFIPTGEGMFAHLANFVNTYKQSRERSPPSAVRSSIKRNPRKSPSVPVVVDSLRLGMALQASDTDNLTVRGDDSEVVAERKIRVWDAGR